MCVYYTAHTQHYQEDIMLIDHSSMIHYTRGWSSDPPTTHRTRYNTSMDDRCTPAFLRHNVYDLGIQSGVKQTNVDDLILFQLSAFTSVYMCVCVLARVRLIQTQVLSYVLICD